MMVGTECIYCGSHRTEYESVTPDPGYIICRACGRMLWMALDTEAMPEIPPPDNDISQKFMKDKTCVVCGKVYQHANGKSGICSPECRKKRALENRQTYREKHNILGGRVCPVCGTRWLSEGRTGWRRCPACRETKGRQQQAMA